MESIFVEPKDFESALNLLGLHSKEIYDKKTGEIKKIKIMETPKEKSDLQKVIDLYGYTVKCATATYFYKNTNGAQFKLKTNYSEKNLNTFFNSIEIDSDFNDVTVIGVIWLNNGNDWIELNPIYPKGFKLMQLPDIPKELIKF
jgi:hypothetical protein